jgi:hypothetical protein
VVSCTTWPLYPQGKSPWYPLDSRLGGPQSRSGHSGEEENSQPPLGIEPYTPDRQARNLVFDTQSNLKKDNIMTYSFKRVGNLDNDTRSTATEIRFLRGMEGLTLRNRNGEGGGGTAH